MSRHPSLATLAALGLALAGRLALAQEPPAAAPAPAAEPAAEPAAAPAAEPMPAEPAPADVAPATEPAPYDVTADTELSASAEAEARPRTILVAVKAGGFFPQPFTDLGTNFVVGVELAYALPALGRRLSIGLGADYAQPPAEGSGSDPRFPSGEFEWSITQRELSFHLAATCRLPLLGPQLVPYVSAGPKLYLLQTVANGSSGGEAFGEQTEQSTKIGGFLALGIEYALGPGALLGEVNFTDSDLDHLVTGDASTGALDVRVGYRLGF